VDGRRGDESLPRGVPSLPSTVLLEPVRWADSDRSLGPRLRPRGRGAGWRGELALEELRLSLRAKGVPPLGWLDRGLVALAEPCALDSCCEAGTLRDLCFADLGVDTTLLFIETGAVASGPSLSSSFPGARSPAANARCFRSRSWRSALVSAASFFVGEAMLSETGSKFRAADRGLRLRGLCDPPLLPREPERDFCITVYY